MLNNLQKLKKTLILLENNSLYVLHSKSIVLCAAEMCFSTHLNWIKGGCNSKVRKMVVVHEYIIHVVFKGKVQSLWADSTD